jgi:hypothetical protein
MSAQKEMLLWHQHLLHANMAWIKTLMCDRKWLVDDNAMASLHSGPFIVSKACLSAKAMSRTTKLKSSTVKPTKNNVLKPSHLVPGHCMSFDHYFSPKMGRLPHVSVDT